MIYRLREWLLSASKGLFWSSSICWGFLGAARRKWWQLSWRSFWISSVSACSWAHFSISHLSSFCPSLAGVYNEGRMIKYAFKQPIEIRIKRHHYKSELWSTPLFSWVFPVLGDLRAVERGREKVLFGVKGGQFVFRLLPKQHLCLSIRSAGLRIPLCLPNQGPLSVVDYHVSCLVRAHYLC